MRGARIGMQKHSAKDEGVLLLATAKLAKHRELMWPANWPRSASSGGIKRVCGKNTGGSAKYLLLTPSQKMAFDSNSAASTIT